MATQKTLPTTLSVDAFISSIEDEHVRNDAHEITIIMQDVTGETAMMWGSSIIGFGNYQYQYPSGHKGEACKVGFSPRKNQFALYLACELSEQGKLLEKLGKHKSGKGCLYIKKLSDVDVDVLKEMIGVAFKRPIAFAQ